MSRLKQELLGTETTFFHRELPLMQNHIPILLSLELTSDVLADPSAWKKSDSGRGIGHSIRRKNFLACESMIG